MKSSKLFLISVFVLIVSATTFAQEQKYFEISVSEHIKIEPSIKYDISFGKFSEMDEKQQSKIDSVKNVLNENNLDFDYLEIRDYSLKNQTFKAVIRVKSLGKNSLEKLYSLLRNIKDIDGEIADYEYYEQSDYYYRALNMLYKKAHSMASFLAEESGNKVGKLISATNVDSNSQNSAVNQQMEMTERMMKNSFIGEMFNFKPLPPDFTKSEKLTLTFKFELM